MASCVGWQLGQVPMEVPFWGFYFLSERERTLLAGKILEV